MSWWRCTRQFEILFSVICPRSDLHVLLESSCSNCIQYFIKWSLVLLVCQVPFGRFIVNHFTDRNFHDYLTFFQVKYETRLWGPFKHFSIFIHSFLTFHFPISFLLFYHHLSCLVVALPEGKLAISTAPFCHLKLTVLYGRPVPRSFVDAYHNWRCKYCQILVHIWLTFAKNLIALSLQMSLAPYGFSLAYVEIIVRIY